MPTPKKQTLPKTLSKVPSKIQVNPFAPLGTGSFKRKSLYIGDTQTIRFHTPSGPIDVSLYGAGILVMAPSFGVIQIHPRTSNTALITGDNL